MISKILRKWRILNEILDDDKASPLVKKMVSKRLDKEVYNRVNGHKTMKAFGEAIEILKSASISCFGTEKFKMQDFLKSLGVKFK